MTRLPILFALSSALLLAGCAGTPSSILQVVKRSSRKLFKKPSLILRPENSCLLHKINCCANDCSGYFFEELSQSPETKQTLLLKALFNRGCFR